MNIAQMLWVVSLSAVVWLPLNATADIYRWVDENGRTHLSDVVPPRYSGTATRVDTSASQISPEDQRAARMRAERERQLVDDQRAATRKAQADTAPASGSANAGEILAPQGPDENECAAKWRAYHASQECFAPFVQGAHRYGRKRGGPHVSEEAYLYCKPVPDPSSECSLPPDRR